jgi:two-component system phosphate regulon response regulator PhoB
MKKISLLVVEDETAIRDMLRFALETAGFNLAEAETVSEAERQIANHTPDLILLDWMLPGINGIDFARRLKQQTHTKDIPIIMLTAKAEEINKIKGLETGADDYVTKPFSPRELIARIKTVLRRGPLISKNGLIQLGHLCLNTDTHRVTVNNTVLELPPIEYKLLYFFLSHQDRVYSREQLLNHVWGGESDIDDRTVDVQIRRLRSRLKPFAYDRHIKTVHGAGYQFLATPA